MEFLVRLNPLPRVQCWTESLPWHPLPSDMCSFYKVFSPEEAYKLASRFEFHYTPKKASWLNMTEIELSALSKQCLDRRIAPLEEIRNEVYALVKERNTVKATLNRTFTKSKARQKMQRHCTILLQRIKLTMYEMGCKFGVFTPITER